MHDDGFPGSAGIAVDAFEGKILGSILIPTFQLILLKMAVSLSDLPSPESAFIDPVQYALLMVGVLGVFGVGLTIVSIIGSYSIAGIPGVMAYLVFDLLVGKMLNAEALAVGTLLISVVFFGVLFWVRGKVNQPSHRGLYR
ncbi:hypothetical protein G3A49_13385 [Haloferax volcanii]|uniref:Uncharacterized protein n=1 Tax=Haloferax volcanii TaxID=2246 RepID=A0A6C0UXF1_HALVO|nr:hypothetical protein [Haloferax alexandrinus]QIB79071.1 hypothetical protein G3A49_13385 [Haloferax alexandrinus]